MSSIKLWEFPANSIGIGDVILYHPASDTYLMYDVLSEKEDRYLHGSLLFRNVMALRHSSEYFSHYIPDSLDALLEIKDSGWIREISSIVPSAAAHWKLKHFAIYLKDYGLYEFAASGFEASPPEEGKLESKYIWTSRS
jgi:hypothetical protein